MVRIFAVLILLSACASPQKNSVTTPPASGALVTTPQIVSASETGTPAELFDRAKAYFLEGKFKEAGELFDLVWRGDPRGVLVPPALLHAGLSYEQMGGFAKALERYTTLLSSSPPAVLAKPAQLHKGRVLIALESWEALVQNGDELLARTDLTVLETVEARGEKAIGLLNRSELDKAQRVVDAARDTLEKFHIGESGYLPIEATHVYFALGEIRRLRSELIRFDPPPANFGETFERRAQGLLDAQSAYTDAMRTSSPAWATMAGYRVGTLYQKLHADVMVAKAPAVAKSEQDKQLFEGAMRLRYRVLLKKGLKMMDSTVNMNEKVGDQGIWSSRARTAKQELERCLEAENLALAKLPVSEAELQKTLDRLQAKKN